MTDATALLPEDANERRMFNDVCSNFEGSPLRAMSVAFTIWHRQAPEGGSYREMLSIYANECAKAAALLDSLSQRLADAESALETLKRQHHDVLIHIDHFQEIVEGDRDQHLTLVPVTKREMAAEDARALANRQMAEVSRQSDAEMERVKACDHIACGDEGWEVLRNICVSTMSVASLRDRTEISEKELNNAREAIVSLHEQVETYRSRWLGSVTPEECERQKAELTSLVAKLEKGMRDIATHPLHAQAHIDDRAAIGFAACRSIASGLVT